jgi:hypothetical protein
MELVPMHGLLAIVRAPDAHNEQCGESKKVKFHRLILGLPGPVETPELRSTCGVTTA